MPPRGVPVIEWSNSMPELSIISPSAATWGGVGSLIQGSVRSDQSECPLGGCNEAGAASAQGSERPDPAFSKKMRRQVVLGTSMMRANSQNGKGISESVILSRAGHPPWLMTPVPAAKRRMTVPVRRRPPLSIKSRIRRLVNLNRAESLRWRPAASAYLSPFAACLPAF